MKMATQSDENSKLEVNKKHMVSTTMSVSYNKEREDADAVLAQVTPATRGTSHLKKAWLQRLILDISNMQVIYSDAQKREVILSGARDFPCS